MSSSKKNIKNIIKIEPIVGYDSIDGTKIIFYYRNKENNKKKIKVIENFKWYFYIKKNDFNKNLFNDATEYEEYYEYIKIYCNKQDFIYFKEKLKKNKIVTYEADLTLTKRFMIDNMVEIEEDLSILFFDIETDDTNQGIVIGRDRILSWAACDDATGKIFYFTDDDERKVIISLLKLFNKYDVVIGWNSKQFDIPYLIERIKINKIKTKSGYVLDEYHPFWKKIMHVDMMRRFIKLFAMTMSTIGLSDFSLDEVSNVFLKERKIKRNEKIIELYNNNKLKLKEYNIKDVKLLYNLNKKLKVISLMLKECKWTGTFINQFYVSELLDNFILREAKKNNLCLKTKPKYNKDLEKIIIRGGYVMKPQKNIYENVRIFDFKSLYPSIMINWNISQDSLVIGKISIEAEKNMNLWLAGRKLEDVSFIEWVKFLKKQNNKLNPGNKYIQSGNNQFFIRDKKNAISISIQKLLNERKKYKILLSKTKYETIEYENAYAIQYAIKVLTNSLYGVTADQRTRFFDSRIAEAITTTGQLLNRAVTYILENKLNIKVIYSDTDSVFFSLESDIETKQLLKKINNKLLNYLLKRYNIEKTIISLAYEKKFRKFIMLDKKKYAGHLSKIDDVEVDSILTKGTENVRKNIIKYTRKAVSDLFELILRKNKNEKYIIDWMQDRKKDIFEKDIDPEDISIRIRLTKPIKEYKLKTPHVRLAEKMIKNKEILDIKNAGDIYSQRIDYIIDNTREIDIDAIGATKTNDFVGDWNKEYYWDILISPPLLKILNIVYPNTEWDTMFNLKQQKKTQIEAEKKLKTLEKKVDIEFKKIENEIIKNLNLELKK